MIKTCMLLFLTLVANVCGDIGESESEIKARYGAPTDTQMTESPREVWRAYNSDGKIIYVAFLDRVSQMESYKTPDGSPFARGDIEALLKANSSGGEWKEDPSGPAGKERWFRFNTSGEEEAIALSDPKSKNVPFSVMTSAYRDFRLQQNHASH
jgi:hypothetical protein